MRDHKSFGWLAAFASAAALAGSAHAETVRLVVYHTNDIHGYVLPQKAKHFKPAPNLVLGGCATLAGFLSKETPKDLLLDAGDWWQGTPEGGLTKGQAPVACLNSVGTDVAVLGNHEFDNGVPALLELLKSAKFSVLAANVYDASTNKRVDWAKPYVIKEVHGVKVGIFGLVTSRMSRLTAPDNIKGLRFRDEAEEAAELVPKLRAEGAQVVIALTHMGFDGRSEEDPKVVDYQGDFQLAQKVAGIDLIVGGHSHDSLEPGVREPVHGTLIVQAGSDLLQVGRAELEFDRKLGKVVKAEGQVFNLWPDKYGEDTAVKTAMEKYRDDVAHQLEKVVATAKAPLARSRDSDSAIGDWVTDCMRSSENADAALHNNGGIRSDIAAGPVTLRELYQVMPFDNRVVTIKLSGRKLREALEQGLTYDRGVPQVSGLRVRFDPKANPGKRVLEIKVGDSVLKDDAIYSIATTDFLATGGGGYSALAGSGKGDSGPLIRDLLTQCAGKQSPFAPPALGRYEAAKR
jgi:2',3'-cyclic-nucleotide 2'-phosphodiesterase (5'-nucleotidase family)